MTCYWVFPVLSSETNDKGLLQYHRQPCLFSEEQPRCGNLDLSQERCDVKLAAGVIAELIMVAGYFGFESLPFMYGVTAALGSVIPNLIQACAAIVGAIPLTYVKLFDRINVQQTKVQDIGKPFGIKV